MAVQLTFNKCREILGTLAKLKDGGKICFNVSEKEITVLIESTVTRGASAAIEYAASSYLTSYIRDLSQFRNLITMKMKELLNAQICEKKLDDGTVKNLTQEINNAIVGLKKLKEQYQAPADKDKRRAIKQIINEDFQPLINQINLPATAMNSSSASPLSPQRLQSPLISHADIPTEVQRLRTELNQLREEVTQLRQQSPSSSSKTDTLVVISIALNVIVLAIFAFNFFQEG